MAKRSINDVRAPLMMLYVAAFCGGRMAGLPVWALLGVTALVAGSLAFVFEKRIMGELLNWKTKWVPVSLAAAVCLYAVMRIALRVFSGASMDGQIIGLDGKVPLIFQLMLSLKGELVSLHPIIIGLGGAIVLSAGEEFFWRGFIQLRIMLWAGHVVAVVATSVLYAGFYAIMLGTLAAVAAGLCGLAYSMLTVQSRSLVPAMVCHCSLWIGGVWVFPLI